MGAIEARIAEIAGTQKKVEEELLARSNVVGAGTGFKVVNGQKTDEPCITLFVTHKLPKKQLKDEDLAPTKVSALAAVTKAVGGTGEKIPTDVVEVGYIFALGDELGAGAQTLAKRVRPAMGGYSVGHKDITAGTIATAVYDAEAFPGIPPQYYILSNNHVLADCNAASPGDEILQPGRYDGGTSPADVIAHLTRFVPIDFEPPIPRPKHNNLVDAAIAEVAFHDCNRQIYWIGHVKGWRHREETQIGTLVQKTGRTTNYTTGEIIAINATVDVNYGGGRLARFRDQIVTTAISAGGDSGSLITDLKEVAVGLLFAGSSRITIANHIEYVQGLLGIVVSEVTM
jgi:hypothetical protein